MKRPQLLLPAAITLLTLGGWRGELFSQPAAAEKPEAVSNKSISLPDPREAAFSPEVWRREQRIIDTHQHVDRMPAMFDRAVRIMDQAGVGIGVNLGSGTLTPAAGPRSVFETAKAVADARHGDRFAHCMTLDYAGWDAPDWSARAVAQIEAGRAAGSAGLKEFKRLGLYLRDGQGNLIRIDDPKLDPVWTRCGERGMPVFIHVADPAAFWAPYDDSNERWTELKDHRSWWFGDPDKYPLRLELLAALDRVIARHRSTTFVCLHFGNNAEDPDWVEAALGRNPNMMIDVAARIPEAGRHDPARMRALFTKYQDRILFATDFMVYQKLILGSGGDADQPTDEDAVTFYGKCWRYFETADRDWPHMTPIQGDWTISSVQLPPPVCRKIYFDNARRLLARSLPLPVVTAGRLERDFVPDGILDEPEWAAVTPARLEYLSADSAARPDLSTPVRLLWSDQFLYLSYESPYSTLSTFTPPQQEERIGLWDNDVVEAFIGSDPAKPGEYTEYEWAPTGEQLDLKITPDQKDFAWSSGMQSAAKIDPVNKVWRVEVRIPLQALAETRPQPGTRWKLNLYRHDKASSSGLAFSPTLTGTFHTPARFGWLEFSGK